VKGGRIDSRKGSARATLAARRNRRRDIGRRVEAKGICRLIARLPAEHLTVEKRLAEKYGRSAGRSIPLS
jgi:hypothetical protein